MPIVPSANGPRAALAGGGLPSIAPPNAAVADPRLQIQTLDTPELRPTLLQTPQLDAPQLRRGQANPEAIRTPQKSMVPYQLNAQAAERISDAFFTAAKIYQQYQVKVNAATVDDALNDALEASREIEWGKQDQTTGQMVGGYRNAKGYAAVRRDSGRALPDEAVEEFDKRSREIAKAKLTNGDQRRAYEMQVNDLRARLGQGASQHAAQQFDVYYRETYKSRIENLANQSATLYQDAPLFRENVAKIEQAAQQLASHDGMPAEEAEALERKARSAAVASGVRQAMTDKKTLGAQALLNEFAPRMDTDTVRTLRTELEGKIAIETGEQVGEAVFKGMAANGVDPVTLDTTDSSRIVGITMQSESNGQRYGRDGKILTSTAGAKGEMQVLDSTNLDPGYGVKPARDNSPEERARVGRDYILALTRHYGGDLKKAWAAYNWGPGNLQDAMKEHGGNWFAHAPAETRAYVEKNMKAYAGGGGQSTARTRTASRSEMYDQVEDLLPGVDNADARKAALAYVDRRWNVAEADRRSREEDATNEALTIVERTGGNINAVPPSLKSRVPADQWSRVESYAVGQANGSYTPTNPSTYFLVANPAALRGMPASKLYAMRPELGAQFDNVYKMWQDANAPAGPGKGPDSLNVALLDSIVDNRLTYLGINIKPKSEEDQARLGAIRQFVHQYALDYQRNAGGKIEDYGQMNDMVNYLFSQEQGFRTKTLGIGKGTPGSMNIMTARAADLPGDTRARIESKLRRAFGGRKPTEAQVLQEYFQEQTRVPVANGAATSASPRINWGR